MLRSLKVPEATALALVSPGPPTVIPPIGKHAPYPDTGPESRGVGGGKTAASLGTKACPGLRSGMNSGAGRRHQPPSPNQRQPRVEGEM